MEILEQTKEEPSKEAEPLPVPQKEIPKKNKRRSEKSKNSKKDKQKSEVSTVGAEKDQSIDSKEKRKRNHRLKIDNRASLQEMIDYKNTQVKFFDLLMNPFSRFPLISDNFKIISFDGQPVKHMVLCTVCNAVLLHDKKTKINLLRHLKRHGLSVGNKSKSTKNETITQTEPILAEMPEAIGNKEENAHKLKLLLDDS